MKLLMCLGNPGKQYEMTRHNAGFIFAEELAAKLGLSFSDEPKFKAHIAKGLYNNEAVWIVKPQTYMNLSGEALSAVKSFYKIDINSLFTVYDDISLDTGKIRFRQEGSAGGHNGIKSIIQHAGTQKFDRLKIGIGLQPPFIKSEDYVLAQFDNEQKKLLDRVMQLSIEAFLYYMDNGIEKAQNKYN